MELGLSVEQIAHFRGMVASHNSKILLSSSEAHTKALDVVDAIVANLGELCQSQPLRGSRASIQGLMLLCIWVCSSLCRGTVRGRKPCRAAITLQASGWLLLRPDLNLSSLDWSFVIIVQKC